MSLIFHLNDPCPKCGKPTMQAEIELHPTRSDLAVHNFQCANCGPVKSKILSLKPPPRRSEVVARRQARSTGSGRLGAAV
jgi:hypothetical protein